MACVRGVKLTWLWATAICCAVAGEAAAEEHEEGVGDADKRNVDTGDLPGSAEAVLAPATRPAGRAARRDERPEARRRVRRARAKLAPEPATLQQFQLFKDDSWYRISAAAELGAFAVVGHTLQFGEAGSELDYVREGGQDNLFLFTRATAELELFRHHHVVLLYQPLTLETDATLDRDLRVFDTVFAAGTPLALKYSFDFVRASYLYDFFESPRQELSLGASLQLRDAVIDFASRDGEVLVSNRNVGPVPALKARGRYTFESGLFFGAEVDGIYATLPFANGALFDFEGALLDASVRAGLPLTGFANGFLSLRFVGGGARGTEEGPSVQGDGFTDNWLGLVALTVGAEVR